MFLVMRTEIKKNFFSSFFGGAEYRDKGFLDQIGAREKTLQDLVTIVLIQVTGESKGPSLFSSQLARDRIKTSCPNGALLLTLQVEGRAVSPWQRGPSWKAIWLWLLSQGVSKAEIVPAMSVSSFGKTENIRLVKGEWL